MLTDIYSFSTPFHSYFFSKEKKSSPFEEVYDLKDLTQKLTSEDCDLDQWIAWKKELHVFISEHAKDLQELDAFFTTITEWGMKHDPQKMMAVLVEIVSLDILTDVISLKEEDAEIPFVNIFDLASENALFCPEPDDPAAHFKAEWKKYRPVVLNFIPNLINIFLGAFDFLNPHKKYTTLWEKYLLIEIVCKLFILPYCLVKILQPFFVVTTKVYVVATLTIATIGILLSCYQCWWRPIPEEIINCTNLDKKMEQGYLEPKVGQAKEMERLIAALEVDKNVLLMGISGAGKTALIHHWIELKHQEQLSEKLQQLTVQEVDCGYMISSLTYGHAELISQTKDQTESYEDNILFFLDEFDQVASNPAAFHAFKKRFLEDKPHAKFVATITSKEFEKLKALDKDGSFRRRVVPIVVQTTSDEQNRWILQDFINRQVKDIPVTDDAIEAVLEVSARDDYWPGIGRPAKANKILTDAIGMCRAGYNPHYVSVELSEARQDYEALRLQATREIKATPDTLKSMREVKARIEELEGELNQNKRQVQKIRRIITCQQQMNADYYRLTHLLAQAVTDEREESFDLEEIFDESKETATEKLPKESISQKDQILYLWYYFYAIDAMKKLLQCEIDKVKSQMPVQIDANLIYDMYEESKAIEQDLFDDLQEKKGDDLDENETE